MIRVLYFAAVKETIGVAADEVAEPCPTVMALVETLRARGGTHAEALSPTRRWRVAVNQEMADLDAPLRAGDEVAIFPPVTGG